MKIGSVFSKGRVGEQINVFVARVCVCTRIFRMSEYSNVIDVLLFVSVWLRLTTEDNSAFGNRGKDPPIPPFLFFF